MFLGRRFPILDRFAPGLPAPAFVNVGSLASGFTQAINGAGVRSPLPVFQNPGIGVFVADLAELPARGIGAGMHIQYIPAYEPDAKIGGMAIGRAAIAHHVPFHGTLIAITYGDLTVYEPAENLVRLLGFDGTPLLGYDGSPLYALPDPP